jgi:hypothetical protein
MRMPVRSFSLASSSTPRSCLLYSGHSIWNRTSLPFFTTSPQSDLCRPPSQMEFKRFPELLDIGFDHARELIAKWAKDGELPTGTEGEISEHKIRKRGQSIRRNSI